MTSSGLELLLRRLLTQECPATMDPTSIDLLSLVGKLRGRLPAVRYSLLSRLAEDRSAAPFAPLESFYQLTLPWSLNHGSPWADSLLTVAATRFVHVRIFFNRPFTNIFFLSS